MGTRVKIVSVLAAGLIAIGWSQTLLAQSQLAADANRAVQITEARKANAALMRQYAWHSRTEVFVNGQLKDTRIELVNYSPAGQLQRSLLNDERSPLPLGFLRRAIAEKEREQVKESLSGLQNLLEQYTLPTTGKVLDFMTSAKTTGPDASGLLQMTGSNVVLPGDSLTLWMTRRTLHTRRMQVNTTFKGNPVQLVATFNSLPGGLNYVSYAEVTVPAEQLSVQVQNFDYVRTTPVSSPEITEKKIPPAPPAAAAGNPLPLGTIVPTLPAGCISTPVGGVEYYYCGGNFYRAVFQGNNLVYVTAQPK